MRDWFPFALSYVIVNILMAHDSDKMLAMPVGWKQTVPYPGRSPTISVLATPALQ